MCGVEGAEYGFTADIRVARDDYYRCAVSLPDAPRVWALARGRGPGARLRYLRARPVPAGARRSPRPRRRTS